ncbi:unnamed protein product [Porites evermanni]|uniref:Transposase n=1 Tax=Porites evermanni TaxID=104178 RepID=A0ABN8Q629_9CNID|nr:unnamed protein product [Porites evermanni]
MSRKLGGRGLKSVENEYKNTKIKAAVKFYCNTDPTMAAVRSFEELAVQNRRHYIIKDAKKYVEELDLHLWLNFPNPVAVADGKEVEAKNVKQAIYKARHQERKSTVSEERWLSSWKNAPTHTIVRVQELYQQLLPTKVYYNRKAKSQVPDKKFRLCRDSLENPLYENGHATAFWDVQLFANTTQVKANRIDATVIDKTSKQVRVIEMSCPWLENRESKDFEKTTKYGQLRLELTNRYPEYKVNQYHH